MGFLKPFVPAIIKGGIGIGSSILGSKLSGGAGGIRDAKGLLDLQRQNIASGRDIAANLQPGAKNLLDMASTSFSPVANYFGRLLAGNRGESTALHQPEVSRITEGYDKTQQSMADLNPRGGGRASLLSDLPFQRTRDITSLLNTSRASAAPGLLDTASRAGAQGSSLYSAILNALSGASSGTSSLLGYDLADRRFQLDKGRELGKTIFDMLQKLNLGGKGGGGQLPLPKIPSVLQPPPLPPVWNSGGYS